MYATRAARAESPSPSPRLQDSHVPTSERKNLANITHNMAKREQGPRTKGERTL